MGDYNNPNGENNNPQDNQNSDQSQNQQPSYQEPLYQQPQYQEPQYQSSNYQQSQYQQPNSNQYQQYQQYNQVPPKKNNSMAIGALVCGIVSLVISCCFFYISLPLGIVGIVLGIISIKNKTDGRTMAIIGIILSSISLLLAIILIISCIALAGNENFMNEFYKGFYKSYQY